MSTDDVIEYAYVSTNPLFRSLTLKEVNSFRDHASRTYPDPIDSWNVFHPVCRQEWIRRGIMPKNLALTWKFADGGTCVGYYISMECGDNHLQDCDDDGYCNLCQYREFMLNCRRIDGGVCIVSSDKVSEATNEDRAASIKYFKTIGVEVECDY